MIFCIVTEDTHKSARSRTGGFAATSAFDRNRDHPAYRTPVAPSLGATGGTMAGWARHGFIPAVGGSFRGGERAMETQGTSNARADLVSEAMGGRLNRRELVK